MTAKEGALTAGTQVTKGITLVRPLGAGGMGAVWVADHAGLQTQVVVKFMLSGLDQSTQARTRFSREAAAAALVKSPHVVQMLDHGLTDDGVPFIVMEHLEGKSLGQAMDEHGRLAPNEVIAVVTQVSKALSKVHGAGLLHRDIKPDNIFLCSGEDELFVKLLDFGIVKTNTNEQAPDSQTKTGQVVGTPFYMSPEQVNAEKTIDARTDLWALAVVAFEALTGRKPFDGPSFGALAVAIVTTTAPKPSDFNKELSPAVDAWFERALARDPARRYPNARELAEAFRVAFGMATMPPPSADSAGALSDSGSRGLSDSGPRDASRSPRAPTPTELDATVEDSAHGSRGDEVAGAALARSEPAGQKPDLVSAASGKKSSPATKIGMLVAPLVGVFFVWFIFIRESATTTSPMGGPELGASAAKPVIHPASSNVAPPLSESVVAVPPSASAVASAPSASASASAKAAPPQNGRAPHTTSTTTSTSTSTATSTSNATSTAASPPPSASAPRGGNDPLL